MKKNLCRKINLVEKFREFYFALPYDEQKALFDIMTALRGEDGSGSCTLKTLTTARIRGALFGKSQKDFCKRALCFASLKTAKEYNKHFPYSNTGQLKDKWGNADFHFTSHIKSAINALEKYGFKRTISDLVKLTRSTPLTANDFNSK